MTQKKEIHIFVGNVNWYHAVQNRRDGKNQERPLFNVGQNLADNDDDDKMYHLRSTKVQNRKTSQQSKTEIKKSEINPKDR